MAKPPITIVPSHAIGTWLLGIIHSALGALGIRHNPELVEWIYLILVAALSLGIGWLIKRGIVLALRKFVTMRHSAAGAELLRRRVISRCAHFIPPLVFLGMIPLAFNRGSHLLAVIERLAGAYTIITLGIGISAVMEFCFYRCDAKQNTRNLPIKGILNIGRGISWIIVLILAVAVVLDKSPAYLLTGLGAFAAALMLIFKDSILGFVAGIQMTQNDMLHVGDWVTVPGTPANGIVQDVSLSAVKIQNFDNTIVTVPPYTLVSTSFQNYRGMKETGARRFDRTFVIDYTTVKPCDEALTARIVTRYPEMKPFVEAARASATQIEANPGIRPLNGTLQTNLGLFRAYASLYLLNSPWVNSRMQILVRILDPSATGFPLNIYGFAISTDWNEFEAIQSAIMEHLSVALTDFGLAIYTPGALAVDLTTKTTQS